GAELIAQDWDITRSEMEGFALTSHGRAVEALDRGLFDTETVPLAGVAQDEGPRRDTDQDKLAGLQPLRDGGRLTAGLASQISDGAAALLIASPEAVRRHRLPVRARIHHVSARGDDPVRMLSAPIAATRHALSHADLHPEDIDQVE